MFFTGTKPVPGTWKNWKVKRLQSKPLKRMEKEASQTAEQMMHAAALNRECKSSKYCWIVTLILISVNIVLNLTLSYMNVHVRLHPL